MILVPTRELAMQVHAVYEQLRGKLPQAALVIGGMPEKKQIASLRSGARVIVATPGRLEDYLKRKLVDLKEIQILVLDEADRMLDMGFLPAIRKFLRRLRLRAKPFASPPPCRLKLRGWLPSTCVTPFAWEHGSTLKPAASVELHAFEVSQATS